jgi:hypothetical protein
MRQLLHNTLSSMLRKPNSSNNSCQGLRGHEDGLKNPDHPREAWKVWTLAKATPFETLNLLRKDRYVSIGLDHECLFLLHFEKRLNAQNRLLECVSLDVSM